MNSNTGTKKYFETAYNTGTDTWTHTPFEFKASELIEKLKSNDIVLDIGSGRGRFPFTLEAAGFRVIGVDYVSSIVKKNNEDVKLLGLEKRIRFVEADVFDMPFADDGFQGALDVGLLHHLSQKDHASYAKEVSRVLARGAYFYLVVFSRETPSYLSWFPSTNSSDGSYDKDELLYYFFTKDELEETFGKYFSLISISSERVSGGINPAIYYRVLLQKK